MLYVERDKEGRLIAIHSTPQANAAEAKTIVDEEILDFLNKTVSADSRKLLLSLSDMAIIRLLEDLIDLLIQKNIITFTELPAQAQERLKERKRLRESMAAPNLTVDDII